MAIKLYICFGLFSELHNHCGLNPNPNPNPKSHSLEQIHKLSYGSSNPMPNPMAQKLHLELDSGEPDPLLSDLMLC